MHEALCRRILPGICRIGSPMAATTGDRIAITGGVDSRFLDISHQARPVNHGSEARRPKQSTRRHGTGPNRVWPSAFCTVCTWRRFSAIHPHCRSLSSIPSERIVTATASTSQLDPVHHLYVVRPRGTSPNGRGVGGSLFSEFSQAGAVGQRRMDDDPSRYDEQEAPDAEGRASTSGARVGHSSFSGRYMDDGLGTTVRSERLRRQSLAQIHFRFGIVDIVPLVLNHLEP